MQQRIEVGIFILQLFAVQHARTGLPFGAFFDPRD
jgi:hypothetical protein